MITEYKSMMITEYNLLRIDELVFSSPTYYYDDILKINISNDKTQLYFLLSSPPVINRYDYLQKNKISLEPFLNEIIKFYDTICRIEKKISEIVQTEFNDFELRSIIDKEGNLKYPLYVINIKNLKIRQLSTDFKHNCPMSFVLDLSEVWIDLSKKTFGINAKLVHNKYELSPYTDKEYFIPHKKIIPLKKEVTETDKNNASAPIKFVPSLTDIIGKKNNLKKL